MPVVVRYVSWRVLGCQQRCVLLQEIILAMDMTILSQEENAKNLATAAPQPAECAALRQYMQVSLMLRLRPRQGHNYAACSMLDLTARELCVRAIGAVMSHRPLSCHGIGRRGQEMAELAASTTCIDISLCGLLQGKHPDFKHKSDIRQLAEPEQLQFVLMDIPDLKNRMQALQIAPGLHKDKAQVGSMLSC